MSPSKRALKARSIGVSSFAITPMAWALGALAVGYVGGGTVAAALRGAGEDDQRISHSVHKPLTVW